MDKTEIKMTLEELVDIDVAAKQKLKERLKLEEAYEEYVEQAKKNIDNYYNNLYEQKTKEFYNREIKEVLQEEREIEKSTEEEKNRLSVSIEKSKEAITTKLFDFMVTGGTI